MEKITINLRDNSIEQPYINQRTRQDQIVRWDSDNLFPEKVLEIANGSPMLNAILEGKKHYMLGAGLEQTKENIFSPNMKDDWFDLLEKCITDFVYYSGFSLQAILNEDGTHWSFYYQPFSQVRLYQYNDKNQIVKAALNTDWSNSNRNHIVEISMFGSETPKKGKPYLLYFKRHQPNQFYYPTPDWWSCANYAVADAELSKYYLNYISNNFAANTVIRFPDEPDEEKKQELYENLKKSFGGARNAGSILLLFGENDVLPEIGPLESVDADLYENVIATIKLMICSACRLSSPSLVGIQTSVGFASKSDEMLAAITSYMLNVIRPDRQFVLRAFNDLLTMNGLPKVLSIADYDYRQEYEGNQAENKQKEDEGIDAEANEEANDAKAENNIDKSEV